MYKLEKKAKKIRHERMSGCSALKGRFLTQAGRIGLSEVKKIYKTFRFNFPPPPDIIFLYLHIALSVIVKEG